MRPAIRASCSQAARSCASNIARSRASPRPALHSLPAPAAPPRRNWSLWTPTILNNATGILIQPTGGIAANVRLRWLRIDNNTGEGLRIDGTGGSGTINAALGDSTASFNAGNGIDAVSGPGNVTIRHHARGRGYERLGRHPVQSNERRYCERHRGQLGDALTTPSASRRPAAPACSAMAITR